MSHTFLLSYARKTRDEFLVRFFNHLAAEVTHQTGGDEPGFMDTRAIEVGESWSRELFDALQSARVLVPVYAPQYFQRAICGQEWGVFHLRQEAYRIQFGRPDATPPVILPVLWTPEERIREQLPPVAAAVQYKHEDFDALYAREGLRHLMAISKHRDRYREIVRGLAKRVVDAAAIPLPRAALPSFDEVPNVFTPPEGGGTRVGPLYVKFVYVAATEGEWKSAAVQTGRAGYGRYSALEWHPYHPEVQDAIGLIAQEVATSRRLLYQDIPVDANSPTALVGALEEAERNGNIIVLIVDPWTLRLEGYFRSMQECDALASRVRYVVACPWDPEQEKEMRATLENALHSAFPLHQRHSPEYLLNPLASAPDLKDRLASSLEVMRKLRIAAQSPREGGSALPLVSAN